MTEASTRSELRRALLCTRVDAHLEGSAMRSMRIDPNDVRELLEEIEALREHCRQVSGAAPPPGVVAS